MTAFEFFYEIEIEESQDVRMRINYQRRKEFDYFERYGKTLDKSSIPSSVYCNDEKKCCPYCVGDACLLFGGLLLSTYGYYGFSSQKRNDRCRKKYPKGKNLRQIDLESILKGGAE